MNKKTILLIVIWICLAGAVISVGETFIDPKSNITIKNCDSCYNNKEIGFNYNGNHYIIPRYDFQGDRTLNKTLLLKLAVIMAGADVSSSKINPDTDIRLRSMDSIK